MPKRKTAATSRRSFVKSMALGAGALASTPGFRVMASGLAPYSGRLLVTLELNGGADVTQLCDPKVNTPGELKINHWADTADPEKLEISGLPPWRTISISSTVLVPTWSW